VRSDDATPLELVLPDGSRVALTGDLTLGRAPGNSLRLADASVSRTHARISRDARGETLLRDAGSSYGTWLDGSRLRGPSRLRPGARIRLGDLELRVDRQRTEADAGPTVVVPANASLTVPAAGRPRVRSGHALKRLEAAEGPQRWVLEDLRRGRFVRLSDADAELFGLLDGSRSLAELVQEADRRLGPGGSARLMLLLASLGERGLLSGTQIGDDEESPRNRLGRLVAPHNRRWAGAGAWFERVYAHAAWLLRPPGLAGLGILAVAGAIAFAYLVAGRYGTPFIVASKLGLGGLVFIAGRFAIAAIHETAHGVVLASFGRRVREAGFKRVLIFPYVYVDTSDAWFEPRRRRMAVSAAGPVSDLCLAGAFSLCCLAAAPGSVRDILFQLAFGAYVAAFFNLNPLVERDGYHVLTDLLREPALRRKSREQLRRELAGGPRGPGSVVLRRYALACVVWSVLGAAVAMAMSLRYLPTFSRLASAPVAYAGLALVWLTLCAPLLAMVGPPLVGRVRARAG
jgi:putative peptide zinc metalloprotease protein